MIKRKLLLLSTLYKLGLCNVARVFIYRVALKAGYYRLATPIAPSIEGKIFSDIPASAESNTIDNLVYFSFHEFTVSGTPDWFANPWRQNSNAKSTAHWSSISDFSSSIGDIKTVWEASRFDWAPKVAWQSRVNSEKKCHETTIEVWIRDWCKNNPPNQGVNWKCGQEASLRVLNTIVAAKILNDPYERPTSGFLKFLEAHAKRILPTIHYAVAQDNNHGTSEAVALFVVGAYLRGCGFQNERLTQRACIAGRNLLENRVGKLIAADGSFSQASVTYHRLMLDSIVVCELFRREFMLPEFSSDFYSRMKAATNWLHAMVDMKSGDVPNLGANDGAYILNIGNNPYRDFRPSLQRALVVFCERRLPAPASDELLQLFDSSYLNLSLVDTQRSCFFPDGGYGRLNMPDGSGHLVFRFPKYNFRVGHCDANHLDFWLGGKNVIIDSGTFSYNPDHSEHASFFSGTRAHSTVAFDCHDQMPSISRFMRANWLRPDHMEFSETERTLSSAYTDYKGASHKRSISVKDGSVAVYDDLGGFEDKAILRWRLKNLPWIRNGNTVETNNIKIAIEVESDHTVELIKENSSLHYLEIEEVPVIKVCVKQASRIITYITF
ncbi:MAG: heparinase II/III-family protein [Granulosicoccus sp.]